MFYGGERIWQKFAIYGGMLMSQIEKASATLTFDENKLEIIDFEHYVSDEEAGNPYNCYFRIKALSDGFSALSAGCEYDYKEWKRFIESLEQLISFEIKKVSLIEICVGNHIEFVCDRTGHIIISGEIGSDAGSHFLKFEFRTDQTALQPFIRELKKL